MPRQKEFDPAKVLEDAMLLFRDQGYDATSVQDLVDRTGINRFSLYATFNSKQDLFEAALGAYYNQVAIPFFDRLATSNEGLAIIEEVLLELVSRIKCGVSSNGCLICNSIAELGARPGPGTVRVYQKYFDLVEVKFYAAILRARELGEVPEDIDARGHAKRLVTYSTGLLIAAKVQTEEDLRQSVKATVRAIQ
jgi:TetR/AcrR family transcriptional repressor of nem operon